MNSLFISSQARAILLLAVPVVFVTQTYGGFNTYTLITQILTYVFVAFNAECLVSGGCNMWSWLSVSVPLLYSVLYIFFARQLRLRPSPPTPTTLISPIKRV